MIKMENIGFGFDGKTVLKDVNLSFEKGLVYSVLGINGSGKTTLLRILGRYLKPEIGKIFIDERNIWAFKRKEFARKVAYLPQSRTVPDISVSEFISHGRFPYTEFSRKLSNTDREIIDFALEITQLKDLRKKNLNQLSGGERQRAYVALVLAQDTEYILMDEPATYLDISYKFQIAEILRALAEHGKCVISVQHDLALALKYSDGVVLLDNNKVLFEGDAEECVKSKIVDKAFGVKCAEIELKGQKEYIFEK